MNTLAFLGPIGTPELIILGFLGLLIFGKRLPEVFNGLGSSIRTFKQGLNGVEQQVRQSGEPTSTQPDNQASSHAALESRASPKQVVAAASVNDALLADGEHLTG